MKGNSHFVQKTDKRRKEKEIIVIPGSRVTGREKCRKSVRCLKYKERRSGGGGGA